MHSFFAFWLRENSCVPFLVPERVEGDTVSEHASWGRRSVYDRVHSVEPWGSCQRGQLQTDRDSNGQAIETMQSKGHLLVCIRAAVTETKCLKKNSRLLQREK